ncbi:MAG: Cytochrome c-type biogenesis protein CcdA (DsbD analog), partial [uncultured Friedmanniella sp.]
RGRSRWCAGEGCWAPSPSGWSSPPDGRRASVRRWPPSSRSPRPTGRRHRAGEPPSPSPTPSGSACPSSWSGACWTGAPACWPGCAGTASVSSGPAVRCSCSSESCSSPGCGTRCWWRYSPASPASPRRS